MNATKGDLVNLLFSYGTLQQDDVQRSTFGRLLLGRADALVGYAQTWLKIEDAQVVATSGKTHHPIVRRTGHANDRVSGTVFEISDAELAHADAYEVADYRRVRADLASGQQAWVYIDARSHNPLLDPRQESTTMNPNDLNSTSPWNLAERAHGMNPSAIREILKVTERPGILNFAGGLPSPETFPVEAMRAACDAVLGGAAARPALQYASSEGLPELRQWVAAEMAKHGAQVSPDQVLITTGSQQGLDLIAKVLIDKDSPILVESPTYLGALQAFMPMQPKVVSIASDSGGLSVPVLREQLSKAEQSGQRPRFIYLLPNFQNPTGRTMDEQRRGDVIAACREFGLPIVEDNPYGELWFDAPPPAPLLSRWPEGVLYLGSFSKILAPGLRLGYVIAPPALYPKLLQAKQAADLHTPGFNQRVVAEVIKDGFLDTHVPTIRARYHAQRDAMLAALARELGPTGAEWTQPVGGMFVWVRLPEGLNAQALLPKAVDAGMAFVPGAPFYADHPDPRTLRLSFVTATPEQIDRGIAALGRVIRQAAGG